MTSPLASRFSLLASRFSFIGVIVLLVSGSVLGWASLRGWYPHDEGLLGQSAERVLRGEVPHRDFDDPYTGGLALVHAAAFAAFGIKLSVLRLVLAVTALAWITGVYATARHWLSPSRAGLLTLLVLVWSVPLYPAAVPSWFVLFLVSAAGAAMVVGRARWPRAAVVGAGVLLGLALLVKVTALFGVAGILLAIARERQLDGERQHASGEVVLGAFGFAIASAALVAALESARVLVHVAGPAIVLAVALGVAEVRVWMSRGRIGYDVQLWQAAGLLTAGLMIPLVPFAIWLANEGALAVTLRSVAGAAASRAAFAATPPPTVASIGLAVGLIALVYGPLARRLQPRMLVALLAALFVLAWLQWPWHRATWLGLRGLLPVGAAACALLWVGGVTRVRQPAAFTIFATLAGCMALTQFPFAPPVYFLYVVPLMFVAIFAFRPDDALWHHRRDALALFLLLFGALQVLPGAAKHLGTARQGIPSLVVLDVPRGGLRVSAEDAATYGELVAVIDSLPDGAIWAGPDAPEVAFLTARRAVGGAFFDFLAPPGARTPFDTVSAAFPAAVVVIQRSPAFSPELSSDQLTRVSARYPRARSVGSFTLRTREQQQ